MRGKVRKLENNKRKKSLKRQVQAIPVAKPRMVPFGRCRQTDKRCVFWDGECLAPYPGACPFEPGPIDDEH